MLTTVASNGEQVAGVNFSTIKDKSDFREAFDIALGLEAVTTLNLNGMPVSNRDLSPIGQLTELQSLSLADCDVGGEGLGALSRLGNLETLYLNRTKVNDADLADLRYFPKLTAIDLSGSAVSSDLSPLVKLPKLKLVVLSNVSLEEGALAGLASTPALTRLNLSGASYAATDLENLKSAVPALVIDE